MNVGDLLDREVVALHPRDGIDKLIDAIRDSSQDVFPVIDGRNIVVGSVTEMELITAAGPNRRTFPFGPRKLVREGLVQDVEDIMSPRPATVHPDDTLESALRRMQELRLPQIVVLERDGRLAGLLRGRDAFCALFGEIG